MEVHTCTGLSVFTDKKFSGPIENASKFHVNELELLKFEQDDRYANKLFAQTGLKSHAVLNGGNLWSRYHCT